MRELISHIDEMQRALSKLMVRRTWTLNPFKLDPVEYIYKYALNEGEWRAVETLQQNNLFDDQVLNKANNIRVIGVPEFFRCKTFSVPLPYAGALNARFLSVIVPWDNMPSQIQEYIARWVKNKKHLTRQQGNVVRHVRDAVNAVNTWGQLATLWPDLIPFFPEKAKIKANYRKVKSRLPEDVFLFGDKTAGYIDTFEPVTMNETISLLCEALMLPEDKHPRPSFNSY